MMEYRSSQVLVASNLGEIIAAINRKKYSRQEEESLFQHHLSASGWDDHIASAIQINHIMILILSSHYPVAKVSDIHSIRITSASSRSMLSAEGWM